MLNKVFLMGRMTADPELRHTQSGVAVTTFRLAVPRDYRDKDGERKSDFFSVVCWRGSAEFVSRYMRKGALVVVEGRLQVRDYEDSEGNRRFVTEVVSENVYGAERKKEESEPQEAQFTPIEDDDDDIPF